MDRPRLLLIANPAARRVRNNQHLGIARILSQRYSVEPVCSTSAEHVREAAGRAAAEGFSVVAAMGGDGLISNAVSGLAGSGALLAIIPAGTANASARSLGIAAGARAAARELAAAPTRRPLPVARLTLHSGGVTSTRYALSQVGLGLDAEVVRRVEACGQHKRRFGELYFAFITISVLTGWARRRKASMHVHSGERRAQAVSLLIQVRWPYTYLGPVTLALTPESTPGMDALVVRRFSGRAMISAVTRALTVHTFHRCPGVELWPGCTDVHIEADPGMVAQADGEPLGFVESMDVTWSTESLLLANPVASVTPRRGAAEATSPHPNAIAPGDAVSRTTRPGDDDLQQD
ncbi:MAG: diacylglycerol kinase family protein [Candidatus Dormibacteria bacterium]